MEPMVPLSDDEMTWDIIYDSVSYTSENIINEVHEYQKELNTNNPALLEAETKNYPPMGFFFWNTTTSTIPTPPNNILRRLEPSA